MLVTAGDIEVRGRIAADGAPRPSGSNRTGAGGTINLSAPAIRGPGRLSAQHGTTQYSGTSSDGLIALRGDASAFTGELLVKGSTDEATGIALALDGRSAVVRAGAWTLGFDDIFDGVEVRSGTTLRLAGRAVTRTPATVRAGATLVVAHRQALEAFPLGLVEGTLRVGVDATSLTPLSLRGTLVLNARLDLPSFTAEPGAIVTHNAEVTSLHLVTAGLPRVSTGAQVDVSGKGVPGPYTLNPVTFERVAGSTGSAGGSHGGLGGRTAPSELVAPVYDNPLDPRFGGPWLRLRRSPPCGQACSR